MSANVLIVLKNLYRNANVIILIKFSRLHWKLSFRQLRKFHQNDIFHSGFPTFSFQLHVSLSSDLVTEYHEEFSLTTASFIGQLGGILNLWIGISFFTIIEIIDLLLRLLQTFAKRPQREKDSTDKVTDKQ